MFLQNVINPVRRSKFDVILVTAMMVD
jgi:hypothetical protein